MSYNLPRSPCRSWGLILLCQIATPHRSFRSQSQIPESIADIRSISAESELLFTSVDLHTQKSTTRRLAPPTVRCQKSVRVGTLEGFNVSNIPKTRAPAIIAGNVIPFLAGTIFFAGRVVTRASLLRTWSADDWLLSIGWVRQNTSLLSGSSLTEVQGCCPRKLHWSVLRNPIRSWRASCGP